MTRRQRRVRREAASLRIRSKRPRRPHELSLPSVPIGADSEHTLENIRASIAGVVEDSYRRKQHQAHTHHTYALRLLSRAERRLTENYTV